MVVYSTQNENESADGDCKALLLNCFCSLLLSQTFLSTCIYFSCCFLMSEIYMKLSPYSYIWTYLFDWNLRIARNSITHGKIYTYQIYKTCRCSLHRQTCRAQIFNTVRWVMKFLTRWYKISQILKLNFFYIFLSYCHNSAEINY